MAEFIEALSYDFMRNALLAGVLAALLCGVVGSFVVVKRLVFASGGISHAAFGGLGLCQLLGLPALLGAFGAALLCAIALGYLGSERFRTHDAFIGVLWAVGMAFGILCLQMAPGYTPDLMAILFGDILAVSDADLVLALGIDVLLLGVVALFYKEFVAVAFDESFAAVQGVRVRLVLTSLLAIVALSTVMLIQVVGVALVIALLSIPPLLGLRLARDFRGLLVVSVVVAQLMSFLGLFFAYRWDLPGGPAIILTGAAMLTGVAGVQRVQARRH